MADERRLVEVVERAERAAANGSAMLLVPGPLNSRELALAHAELHRRGVAINLDTLAFLTDGPTSTA